MVSDSYDISLNVPVLKWFPFMSSDFTKDHQEQVNPPDDFSSDQDEGEDPDHVEDTGGPSKKPKKRGRPANPASNEKRAKHQRQVSKP
jgi:hypothetical protein